MAKTISTIFAIQDKYTKTMNKITKSTENATKKINKASEATDKFNNKMKKLQTPPTNKLANFFDKVKSKAESTNSSISRLIKTVASLATAKAAIGVIDSTTLTNARLGMINDGRQTDKQLQNKILQSADNSRSSYASTAGNVSKLGLLAPEAFKNNDEIIRFSELLNKSFKVGGASTQEQEAGTYQLTQAMAAGKLQGDEFRSVMENAPLVAQAIADYTGKTKGELKEMSSQGTITADIIKNAMFASAKKIEDRYKKLPKTFGDYWTMIKNKAIRAFTPIIEKINEMINTPQFEEFFNNLCVGVQFTAEAVNWLIDGLTWLYQTLEPFAPLIGAVVVALIAYKTYTMLAAAAQTVLNGAMLLNPTGLLIAGIAALIAILAYLYVTNDEVAFKMLQCWDKIQVGLKHAGMNIQLTWMMLQSGAYALLSVGQAVAAGFLLAWQGLATGVQSIVFLLLKFLQNMVNGFVDGINLIIKAANLIPNVNIQEAEKANFADQYGQHMLDGMQDRTDAMNAMRERSIENMNKSKELMTKGWADYRKEAIGATIEMAKLDKTRDERVKNRNNWLTEVQDKINGALDLGNSAIGGNASPVKVDGGKLDAAGEVNISDEDLKYLKDFAEQEFVNKFTAATLAPNVTIQFGDIHETADAEAIKSRIAQILEEEIAEVAEGVYD